MTPNSRRFDASIGGAWFDSQSHSWIFAGCYDHAILAIWGCSNVWFHRELPGTVNLLSLQNSSTQPLMSKPLATKVSTPLNENVQIGPKVSIFCVATIIFQHCLNPLGHGVHQSFTCCLWSPLPLLHDNITELVDVRDQRCPIRTK